jgi:hypothetical protein
VAVEAIRGVRTAAEIAKAKDVHPNLVAVEKRQALEQCRSPAPRFLWTRTRGERSQDVRYRTLEFRTVVRRRKTTEAEEESLGHRAGVGLELNV